MNFLSPQNRDIINYILKAYIAKLKLSLCLIKHYITKTYGGVGVQIRVFLLVSDQFHTPAALPPGERAPGAHWIGGRVDSRAGPNVMEK
jgi:hypothetical protein